MPANVGAELGVLARQTASCCDPTRRNLARWSKTWTYRAANAEAAAQTTDSVPGSDPVAARSPAPRS